MQAPRPLHADTYGHPAGTKAHPAGTKAHPAGTKAHPASTNMTTYNIVLALPIKDTRVIPCKHYYHTGIKMQRLI